MAEEADIRSWIGRSETATEVISGGPVKALAATLGVDGDVSGEVGDAISPLWIWLNFLPIVSVHQIGADGHPKRGGFLPPISLTRRMWAGGRLSFHAPVLVGAEVSRQSTILNIAEKSGSAGAMVFVTVRHLVSCNGITAIEEEQDLVYLDIPPKFAPPPPIEAPQGGWCDQVTIDPVLLFRFSALTFNAHRIHYDRPYAVEVEHYPGLVVHGPLQAILLFEAAQRHNPHRQPASFSFRGRRPLFDFDEVRLTGVDDTLTSTKLCTFNADRAVGMEASIVWHA